MLRIGSVRSPQVTKVFQKENPRWPVRALGQLTEMSTVATSSENEVLSSYSAIVH